MKHLLLLGCAIFLFTSCNEQDKRYTQQSPEIETYKQVIKAFENEDWEAMAVPYAEAAKIMNNVTKENAQSIDEVIAQNKEDAGLVNSWKFDPDSVEYEMVVTDKGETWVNFWGVCEGTLKANEQLYEIPVHITARFEDGKIVEENGYWNTSKLMKALLDIESAKNMAAEESIMN